jgi:hypothetical protein
MKKSISVDISWQINYKMNTIDSLSKLAESHLLNTYNKKGISIGGNTLKPLLFNTNAIYSSSSNPTVNSEYSSNRILGSFDSSDDYQTFQDRFVKIRDLIRAGSISQTSFFMISLLLIRNFFHHRSLFPSLVIFDLLYLDILHRILGANLLIYREGGNLP